MPDWTTGFSKLGQAVVNKVKLGSAVDAPLVMVVFVTFGSIVAYVITREVILIYLAILAVVIFGVGFVYFMIKDPNKLRTEEHEQTMYRISVGLGQSDKPTTEEKLDKLKPIANPALEQLNEGKTKDK